MKILVIIPTYNEKENILQLVPAIFEQNISDLEILVADDNSPDGTGAAVAGLKQQYPGIHLLSREKKEGLGRAYVAGFNWALERDYSAVIEMDADFSHRPQDLIRLVAALEHNDFVIGSRWVTGGGTTNWGRGRKVISRVGSFYSRCILGYPFKDWTGGFNGWKRPVLEKIGVENIQSDGYSFQIELKYRASRLGFKAEEIPIVFEERRVGHSKMSSKIVFEALYRVWSIKWAI